MEPPHHLLLYDSKYRVLVCHGCQHALSPNGVKRHLKRRHNHLGLDVRKALTSFAETLDLATISDVAGHGIPAYSIAFCVRKIIFFIHLIILAFSHQYLSTFERYLYILVETTRIRFVYKAASLVYTAGRFLSEF
jgi:hypothetical protein